MVAPLFFTMFLAAHDDPEYRRAAVASAQAYYIESRLNTSVDALKDKYEPEIIKKYSVITTVIYQITVDKKIQIHLSF